MVRPCGGSIVALQASTGEQLWKTYTIAQEPTARSTSSAGTQLMGPSGAPVWSSPTYDASNDLIYVTTGDNYSDPPSETSDAILAFSAASGKLHDIFARNDTNEISPLINNWQAFNLVLG